MRKAHYYIELETLTPLVLADKPTDENSSIFTSLDYITGSSVRGAVIQLWKNEQGLSDEQLTAEIAEHFSDSGIVFDHFYYYKTAPLPLTAATCKHFSGFLAKDTHGVKDTLLLQYKNCNHFSPDFMSCQYKEKDRIETCGAMLKPMEGFVRDCTKNGVKSYEVVAKSKIQSGHVAIEAITQTVRKGQLFFENAIGMGETFQGMIHVPEHVEETFARIVRKNAILRIGAKRTSGYGKIQIRKVSKWNGYFTPATYDAVVPFQERWDLFQQKCSDLNIIDDHTRIFSLTLLSDGIFLDKFFRYRSDLTVPLLEELTGISLQGGRLCHQHVETRKISGWNQKWGMALDDESAVRRGSSYLYLIDRDQEEQWMEKVMAIEQAGIGERIHEGYGKVIVCHPFHLITTEEV